MEPASLELQAFGAGDELDALGETRQVKYARRYLTGLGATSTLVEPHYFDRDYLAEHSAFYSLSTRGYPNHCRRLHFFKGEPLTRQRLELVAAGDAKACTDLQDDYLGFIVVRPIVSAPFGRTVLKWWDDGAPMTPRVTHPSRKYTAHLLGQELRVEGLAWQQQDTGVGGCATVALWSMLHSSALDEHHAIPTTVSITQRAHRTASLGSRVFPSPGLTLFQISEAIKESGLEPLPIEGDLSGTLGRQPFSRDVFAVHVSALLRSGYPVLLSGELEGNGLHAVCAVGFREATASPAPAGKLAYQDEETPFFYVHDDNIGPNVRMAMTTTGADKRVVLRPSAPPLGGSANDDATKGYPGFVPYMLLAAVPDTLRVSAGVLHGACIKVGRGLLSVFEQAAKAQGTTNAVGLTVSSRFMKVADYIGNELARLLGAQPAVLAAVRLALIEEVVPMSLHVGVARIGVG
ncbi:MAG: hypothetical protein ACRENE_18865, partial [Polyangiaceae bacterium]